MAPTGGDVDVPATLAAVPLLSGLDGDALARLAERAIRRQWPAGALVVEQDSPGGSLIVLVSGACTVYRRPGDGARAALAHLAAPCVLGEVTLLDGSPRTASVEAVEPTEGVEVQREAFVDVLRESPALLDALLVQLGRLVRRLSDQSAEHILLDFGGRVAKTLVSLSEQGGGPEIRLSQARIAELAGGSRQSLNQVLRTFSQRGLLRIEGRVIVLQDQAALRKRAGLPPATT